MSALHERDMAVADAVNETDYLRRSLSTMSAAGAELATSLSRRNNEYDLLLRRLSDLTATEGGEFATYASEAASRQLPMMATVGAIADEPTLSPLRAQHSCRNWKPNSTPAPRNWRHEPLNWPRCAPSWISGSQHRRDGS